MITQGQKISTYVIRTNKGESYKEEKNIEMQSDCFSENKQFIKNHFADIKYKEIILSDAVIVLRSDTIDTPLHMDISYCFPFIKLHFELEGDSIYIPDNSDGIEVSINKGEYNFFYLPKVKGTLSFYQPKRKSLEIMVSENFLRNSFKSGFDKISSSFGEALKKQIPFKLFEESEAIPSFLMLIINDIINCSYQKEIKEIYLESKIKEIFSYLLAKLNEKNSPQDGSKLTEQERKQVLLAEKILMNYLDKSLTIKKLAAMSGINDYKLKRNFKMVTGKPIFSYLTDIRMEKAKNMLIEEGKNVSEVAYAVGYKNPQHFTSAFKKRFNYLPSDLKKKLQYA